MKKIFTLICALAGFSGAANAASVDDLAVLKHSYVLVCDDLGARPGKGVLFGDNHFLDVTGGSIGTKGLTDLSVVDALGEEGAPLYVTDYFVSKYGEYGAHQCYLRLKNAQDVIAMKLTAKSKVIMFFEGNAGKGGGKNSRYPKIATDAKMENSLNEGPTEKSPAYGAGSRWEYTVDDDGLYYFGSWGGDIFISFIIIEANEAPGTPSVKVGDQTFENGLWFREVTAKANDMVEEGSTEKVPTVLTYTLDGTAPTAASPKYTAPIKCYKDMTIKFQAFMDLFGTGEITDEDICDGADYDVPVNFSFNAPAINVNGAEVTITSEYEGAQNFYSLNATDTLEGSSITLAESATVMAYSKIVNGEYTTFTTKSSSKEALVLNPIKEKQTLTVTGDIVLNTEKTAETDPDSIVANGAVVHDKSLFFIRNTSFKWVDKAEYRVPAEQQAYLMMNGNIITFEVAEGDSVDVVVTCSKNSCKTITLTDEEVDAEGSKVANDRKCFINVDGTNYSAKDAEGNEAADLKRNPNANIVKFGLGAGVHTFQKYSGTGNILVSSIEITPATKQETLLGDVNGDGKVDVEDVVGIVNKILGEPAEGFIEANADVNGDSKIDVDDVVAAVNIILGDTNE